MSEPGRTLRDVATLGLAVGGPVSLFSGIAVGVTLIGGPPVFLVLLFVGGLALSAVSLLVLAADNARQTSTEPGHED
jgi:hypothetical protein